MADQKQRSPILQFAVTFLVVYMITQLVLRMFFPDHFSPPPPNGGSVQISMVDDTVKGGHHPVMTIKNTTDAAYAIPQRCPAPPVDVYAVERAGKPGEKSILLEATETVLPCEYPAAVNAGESVTVDLSPWKYSLFGDYGIYELALVQDSEDSENSEELTSVRFEMYEAGVITQLFRTFVTKPLLNLLILIASLMPGYNLGFAIIILTVAVKLLLFLPTQHAMEGQKRLQAVQPKIDQLREKYKSDPQRLNQEMLQLWKREKINPLQSCLPMLLQFPVLIGLFFVIRDGSSLELSRHLLYGPYQDLSWVFGTNFFGLDLLVPNVYIFPPLLFVLQFYQLKLSFSMAKKRKEKDDVVDVTPEKKKKKAEPDVQQTQQKVMQYVLPVMIAVFAVQFPAAVSLYWGVSTVFALGQQVVVNKRVQ